MRIRSLVAAALFAAALGAHAPPADAAAMITVDASSKVDRVIVYSTRAKVFRRATATLKAGETRVRVATLPTTVNLDSVQVRSKSTKVKRVEVAMARGRLPRQAEAEKLVTQLEALDDKIRVVRDEARVWREQRSFIRDLYLRQPPKGAKQPPEGIFVNTWRLTLRWVEKRNAQARKRLEELREQKRKLFKQRHKLVVAARQLDLSAVERPQLTVTATVEGRGGKHAIMVSYLVSRVSWRPSYDLRYDHVKKRVEATYYADVTQRSGEDWSNASLRFSTGRAMSLVAVPELPTWTLGRKRDFTPKPSKRYERASRRWRASPRPVVISATVRRLQKLLRLRGSKVGYGRLGSGSAGRGGYGKSGRAKRDSLDDLLEDRPRRRYRKKSRRRYSRRRYRRPKYRPSPKAVMPAPSAPPRPVARAERESADSSVAISGRRSRPSGGRSSRWRKRPPVERVPWTDVGYRPPYLPSDSPAKAAKGYLFTLYAPGRHEVPATGAKRRIPVLRTSFRVAPIYRILPGKSKLAYVLAELKNTSGRPILRGHANLFAGTMFSGRSYINTALPGHKMSLPLGVDDSVKVVRHLKQRTVTEGVLFKDDVTEYTVEIEIANNRRYPITVDVRDQVPRKRGRKIEIGGFTYKVAGKKKQAAKATKDRKPGWTGADDQGRVVWIGKIGARKVKKLSFSFRITRPKDWLLRQSGG